MKVGSCTCTDSLVRYWLTSSGDVCLSERLTSCLDSSQTDVTLACLNWLKASCNVEHCSVDTQLSIQVSNCSQVCRLSVICTFTHYS